MQLPNYLKMLKRQQVIALLDLGWSYRRIEAETGVRRETVSRYDRWRRSKAAISFPGSDLRKPGENSAETAKPAISFPGSSSKAAISFPGSSSGRKSAAAAYREVITAKLEEELSVQRIYQDLVADYGYGQSYESVKRFVRRLERAKRPVGVYPTAPGKEAQVDFFRGAPTFRLETGRWEKPWVFRMTLSYSRHGYEEAVWDQKLPTFLALHESAFRDFSGVPEVVRHDNLKSAVARACWYDPDLNDVFSAFAEHWGFTPLPSRPRSPQENGKQERSGGYVKDNGLKGRRFESLEAHNNFLRHWNRTVARLRIHGTTRRQVWTQFVEMEKPALRPLAEQSFTLFESGERIVHPDGHIAVGGAFYPVPARLLGEKVRVRWDPHLVRVFFQDVQQAVHARVGPGLYAPPPHGSGGRSVSQQQYIDRLLSRCSRVGGELRQWAEQCLEARGVRALRVIQGVLALTRVHSRERIVRAARLAEQHQLFRYKDFRRLAEQAAVTERAAELLSEHPSIRPLSEYRLEDIR
jgi:transposase